MALTVNQNIGAMNAHYYLQKSETAFGKAIERLSSGLRINRAADDPAGLVLSEKYRAQVEGLQQAIQNAQDGINLVQTSEGALDEVTTILRSMRKLAVHAASTGTTDSDAASADQQQLESAISQLNDLAANTQFGSRKLLNGESGTTGAVTGTNSSSFEFMSAGANVAEGVYTVNITTAATKATIESRSAVSTQNWTALDTTVADALTGAGAGDTFRITVGSTVKTFTFGTDFNTATTLAAAITNDTDLAGMGIRATYATGGELHVTSDNNAASTIAVVATNVGGTLATALGEATGVSRDSAATDATATSTFAKDQTLTFTDGAKKAVVTVAAGSTMQAAATQVTNALTSAQINATFEFDSANAVFSLSNTKYGDSTATSVKIMASEAGSGFNMNLVQSAGNTLNIASNDAELNTTTVGANVVATVNGTAAASASGLNFTSAEGLEMTTVGGTAANGDTAVVTVTKNELEFQIGAFQNQTVNISLNNVASSELGKGTGLDTKSVANIDLTSAEKAQEAIQVIDAALSEISEMRADLGSFQKDVLESAVRNLGIAAQNMASSESSIRDADMAEEMMDFSRAQILQSTSMAMLAQANQAPQSIMKLFQ